MLHKFECLLVKLKLYDFWWSLQRRWWQTHVIKNKTLIPCGSYCYCYLDDLIPNKYKLITKKRWKACPYLRNKINAPDQNYGYCIYLDLGDFDDTPYISLLWDQCKECGINNDLDF